MKRWGSGKNLTSSRTCNRNLTMFTNIVLAKSPLIAVTAPGMEYKQAKLPPVGSGFSLTYSENGGRFSQCAESFAGAFSY